MDMPGPSDNCIFCKIAAGTAPANIVFQNDELVAFHDTRPAAPVHILIVPRQHITSIALLHDESAPLVGRMMLTAAQIARDHNIGATGYRLVMNTGSDGGQSVFHMHLHLIGGQRLKWPPG